MAISSDTVIEFFGTQDIVTNATGTLALASSAFASTAAVVNWVNDDDAPEAAFYFRGDFGTAPAPGGALYLYARLMAIGPNSSDMTIPSTTNKQRLIAVFQPSTVASTQVHVARAFLPNMKASQTYQFLLENQTSQSVSSTYEIYITPLTKGPAGP